MKEDRDLMIQVISRKKVIQSIRNKFYNEYKNMSLQQRVNIDQIINQKLNNSYNSKFQIFILKKFAYLIIYSYKCIRVQMFYE